MEGSPESQRWPGTVVCHQADGSSHQSPLQHVTTPSSLRALRCTAALKTMALLQVDPGGCGRELGQTG